ncbi:PREDICTED: PELOTA [Prunus dulcis]|uniref:PREDICTED: PELOTA n=1 Tax=Prunus dulcis TaxID=3755 RepID=A0A5E4E242_PRUDU|nr:PREDICTED: PELOTA [Prunus dulcis]
MKEDFRRFLIGEEQRLKLKSIENNKSRIVVVKTSKGDNNNCSGSLHEVLHDNAVMNLIKDTKAAMEIRAYKEFLDMLITDDLFESAEIETRHKVCRVGEVGERGGREGNCVFGKTCGQSGAGHHCHCRNFEVSQDLDDGFVT